MIGDCFSIFVRILLPMFLVVGVGYLAGRRAALDLATLSRLSLFIFAPSYILSRLTQLEIDFWEILQIGVVTVVPVVLGAIVLSGLAWLFRWHRETAATLIVSSLFYNSGNFGVPVAELAFGLRGGQLQAVVVMFTCVQTFFVGYGILAWGQGGEKPVLRRFFQLPYVYVVSLAVVMQWFQWHFPSWFVRGLDIAAGGMVPVALLTLGVQLGLHSRWPRWSLLGPALLLKLCLLPLASLVLAKSMGIWPWPGKLLVLAAAAPTAINTLLMSVDLEGDTELAADCVFWSTVASAVTVAVWLALLLPGV